MTERRSDKNRDHTTHASRLEALYSQAGDVEPEAGLDRIVRARAAEAVGGARSPGRIPWLSGLVTASVAVVAIVMVLQQVPPGEPVPVPESPAPRDSTEADAYMAPSMGAQSQRELLTAKDRPALQNNEENRASARIEGSPAGAMPPRPPASESRQRRTAPAESEPAAAPKLDESALDQVVVTGARIITADPSALESANTLIEKLRDLLEDDRIDEARRLLDEAAELDSELELPDDIERALRRPDSENPELR